MLVCKVEDHQVQQSPWCGEIREILTGTVYQPLFHQRRSVLGVSKGRGCGPLLPRRLFEALPCLRQHEAGGFEPGDGSRQRVEVHPAFEVEQQVVASSRRCYAVFRRIRPSTPQAAMASQ
jgi:hypothetical protein